jgi:thymidine kinase
VKKDIMGKLTFIYGTVGSSKTATLLMDAYMYEHNLNKKVLMIKPSVDTRDDVVRSRVGLERPCLKIGENDNIKYSDRDIIIETKSGFTHIPNVDVIMVDEAQFLTEQQVESLYDISVDYRGGIEVEACGLKDDFRRKMFNGSAALLSLADEIRKIDTLCSCGEKAIINAKYENNEFSLNGPQVGIEKSFTKDNKKIDYKPMCKDCYEKEKVKYYKKQANKYNNNGYEKIKLNRNQSSEEINNKDFIDDFIEFSEKCDVFFGGTER